VWILCVGFAILIDNHEYKLINHSTQVSIFVNSKFIAAEGSTLFLTRGGFSRVHSTQSFARSMYCRDLDLVSICLSVCKDVVIRGGIIKLQERLLNEGSGQNKILYCACISMCSRFFKIFRTDARDRNSKVFGKIQVSMAVWLYFFLLKYIKAMT
jgi:hypothetical protein